MHARVVLGVGKGVLFREVSSVQECPCTLSVQTCIENETPKQVSSPANY